MKIRILKILVNILFLFLALDISAQNAVVKNTTNMRETANSSSRALIQISKGTQIYVDPSKSLWCKTNYKGYNGYVNKNFIHINEGHVKKPSKSPVIHQPIVKSYINSKGQRVQSPAAYDATPADACAQCYDGTYSFSQHRRGTCSHHGGVQRWLK
ncbi:MAG TPA: DUF3761 domain-containing protein [Saprospiraceae bacterium]|nr:DUF3761 domain-containing protein [Saprospiraceae bacterium]